MAQHAQRETGTAPGEGPEPALGRPGQEERRDREGHRGVVEKYSPMVKDAQRAQGKQDYCRRGAHSAEAEPTRQEVQQRAASQTHHEHELTAMVDREDGTTESPSRFRPEE